MNIDRDKLFARIVADIEAGFDGNEGAGFLSIGLAGNDFDFQLTFIDETNPARLVIGFKPRSDTAVQFLRDNGTPHAEKEVFVFIEKEKGRDIIRDAFNAGLIIVVCGPAGGVLSFSK